MSDSKDMKCKCGAVLERERYDRWVWTCWTCMRSVQINGELDETDGWMNK